MEFNFQKITGLLIIFLMGSVGANFYQYQSHGKQDISNRDKIIQLEESNQKHKEKNEDYLNYIKNMGTKNDDAYVKQIENIKDFCLKYFTFSSDDEEKRIQNVSSTITDKLEERMKNLIADDDEHSIENHQLTLTASDVEVYKGNLDEYLATFQVEYESEISSENTQLYTIKFKMTEEKINDFTIVSVQNEGVMEYE